MKIILYIPLFLHFACLSQDIVIAKDTIVNDSWIIAPATRTIRIINSAVIHGTGIIIGGVLDINPFVRAFDTSITVRPYGMYCGDFSASWYGCDQSITDNSPYFQKAIDICVAGGVKTLKIQKGVYRCASPILIARSVNGVFAQSTIHIYGETSFWDSNPQTVMSYTGVDSFFIGFQKNKGSEFDHIKLIGKFNAPFANDLPAYYAHTLATYHDQSGVCADNLTGLAIDPIQNNSGSTGVQVHDIIIDKFSILIGVSQRGGVNADILYFDKIQFGDGIIGFKGTQPQEKGNQITRLNCWGRLHTLISIGPGSGNYKIDGMNVAGLVIRLFNINQTGWFSTQIYNVFAESIASIGTITTGDNTYFPPTTINNSIFDFVLPSRGGVHTLLTTNSNFIKFNNCMFRYYGAPQEVMHFAGRATFDNCSFSGPRVGLDTTTAIINYPVAPVILTPFPVFVPQTPVSSIKLSVRNNL